MRTVKMSFLLGAILCAVGVLALNAAPADTLLLPDQFGAWHASGPTRVIKIQDLGSPWTPGTAGERILKESGAKKIEERVYQNGGETVTLRAYQLRDPSSAFELYTYLVPREAHSLGVGPNSAADDLIGRFLVGNILVESNFPANVKPEALGLIDVYAAMGPKADHTPLPPVRDYLPTEARIIGSEKYALGPEAFQAALASADQSAYANLTRVAGFESGAEAMLARFGSDRNGGVLLLIEYPTPQLAEQHLHHLQGELPSAAKQAGTRIERKASLLSVVLASPSVEYANKLRESVNYETQVTWNEGSHVATEPPMVEMIIKIFTFTGMFLVVATGLGIAFGVARVFIKRYFPGKVFDRPQDIEVLQMGLSGKKIDPSDMY
jgi:hypothetical protein